MKSIPRKRKSPIGVSSEGSWAISYGDMLTLLLGFFVLFFATASQKGAENVLQASILATLKPLEVEPKEWHDTIDKIKYPGMKVEKIGHRIVVAFPNVSFFGLGKTSILSEGKIFLFEFADKFLPFVGKTVVNVVGFTDALPVNPNNIRYRDNLELSALRSVSAQRVLNVAGIPLNKLRIMGHGIKQLDEDFKKELDKKIGQPEARTIVLVIEPEYRL